MKFLPDNGKRRYLKYGAIGTFILGWIVILVAQPWSGGYLFSIDDNRVDNITGNLNDGKISTGLENAFRYEECELSDTAAVTSIKENKIWKISDKGDIYNIENEGRKLNILGNFTLGPSYSPSRILVTYVVTILMLVIPGLIGVYLFTRRNRWIAPHGKYVEGQDYSAYSTYTLTAIAIVAAVYAVGGLPTGVNIDLPSLICAFSAVFFGAHVMFPAVLIGWFVRWAIGGATFIPVPILGGAIGLIDAGVWAVNGFLLWWILRSERFRGASGRKKTGLFIVAILVMVGVWLVGWIFDYAFIGNPWGAFVGYATLAFSTWAATGVAFQILGLFMGQNMYEKWTQ